MARQRMPAEFHSLHDLVEWCLDNMERAHVAIDRWITDYLIARITSLLFHRRQQGLVTVPGITADDVWTTATTHHLPELTNASVGIHEAIFSIIFEISNGNEFWNLRFQTFDHLTGANMYQLTPMFHSTPLEHLWTLAMQSVSAVLSPIITQLAGTMPPLDDRSDEEENA